MAATKKAPEPRFAVGSWAFMYGCDDRFGRGYNPHPLELEEVFDLLAHVEGMEYVAGHFPGEFPEDVEVLRKLAKSYRIGIGSVVAKTFGAKYRNGGLTNPYPGYRKEALETLKRCLEMNNALLPVMKEIARPLGARNCVIWLGHDGSNGLFLCDYGWRWRTLAEAFADALKSVPGCRIALEPKPGDPAEDCFIRGVTAGLHLRAKVDALLPEKERGRFGFNVEYGHVHLEGGKVAESLCLALDEGALFQIDLNDNRKRWDTDHIPGNDNEQEILEAEYWLLHRGFDGIFNFDLFPQRVPGETKKDTRRRFGEHLAECVNAVRYRWELVKRLPPPEEMSSLWADPDETRVSRLLRDTRNRRIEFAESRYRG
ncbi:MAG: TIM barrel protein [Planctomycetes bacterium]|nr:TIM barrel protein [Planctomycetota bacterium]